MLTGQLPKACYPNHSELQDTSLASRGNANLEGQTLSVFFGSRWVLLQPVLKKTHWLYLSLQCQCQLTPF